MHRAAAFVLVTGCAMQTPTPLPALGDAVQTPAAVAAPRPAPPIGPRVLVEEIDPETHLRDSAYLEIHGLLAGLAVGILHPWWRGSEKPQYVIARAKPGGLKLVRLLSAVYGNPTSWDDRWRVAAAGELLFAAFAQEYASRVVLIMSPDHAETWYEISTLDYRANLHALEMARDGTGMLMQLAKEATQGYLYTTTDFGRTWQGPTPAAPAPAFVADHLEVRSAAELRAYLGG